MALIFDAIKTEIITNVTIKKDVIEHEFANY